ncbi:MAG: isoaspartyl peptidase/L-asparaginase [Acidobacteriaceae bacterium]|nr:isoaspartyl peptidase/L-asparaginase [Acidobacteriaceae bacterium]
MQKQEKRKPVLLIHGGAWAMPDEAIGVHERGIRNALTAGWQALERGGTALDAVEAAITVMEDDDTFDAGTGSFLTRDGRVQCDALLMSGKDLKAGGVACVEQLKNPIQAARLVLDRSPHVYFVGSGAERFATQQGMRLIDNMELVVPREQKRLMEFQIAEAAGHPDTTFSGAVTQQEAADAVDDALPEAMRLSDPTLHSHDTVGAVALDEWGNLAAGTSTGGTLSKAPGRVGDSSLIGCGCYADNLSAAVSLTGWGEPMMKLVLGKWAVDKVASGAAPEEAAAAAIRYLYERLGGHGGIILLGPDGSIGLAHNTPRMAWGVATDEGLKLGVTCND